MSKEVVVDEEDDRQQRTRRRASPPPPPPQEQPLPGPSFRCVWCLAPTPALYYRGFSRVQERGGADGAKKNDHNNKASSSTTTTSDVRLASCAHCHAPSVDPYCERELLLIFLDLALLRPHAYRHVLLNRRGVGNDPSSSPFDSWAGLAGIIVMCGLLQACALRDENPALFSKGPSAVMVRSQWLLLMRFLPLWGCLVLSAVAFQAGACGAATVVIRPRPALLPWPVLGWSLAFPALALQSAALVVNVWESGGHGGNRATPDVVRVLGSLLSLAYRAVAIQALVDAHDANRHGPTLAAAPTLPPTTTTTPFRWWKTVVILGAATVSRAGAGCVLATSVPRTMAIALADEGATPPDTARPTPAPLRLCTGLSVASLLLVGVGVPSAVPQGAGWHDLCLT